MNKRFLLATVCVLGMLIANAQDSLNIFPVFAENAMRPIHLVDPSTIKNKMLLYQDSLSYYADSVHMSAAYMYEARQRANYQLIGIMKRMLKNPESFAFTFDSTITAKINIIEPSTKAFRIYQWEMLDGEGLSRYFGVMQMPNGKLHPLVDVSSQVLKQMEDTILMDTRWFGAMYYNILEKQSDKGMMYYLFGINTSNANSDKKIVDCLWFSNTGVPQFGSPRFQSLVSRTPKVCNRFIAEYQKNSYITLNYNRESDMIVFDHLESTIGDNAKRYTFASDGTYDGLRWNGTFWQIVPNAVQITETPEGQAPVQQGIDKKMLTMPEDEEVIAPKGAPAKKEIKKKK
jgi:hypothetical protein